ncbi:MAG: hypothetical protein DWI24_01450 [Planctomycetota bacterium]|nr:MAG: hypothetical protein DWI24_01450 [Planctomycetota bacterium]
MDRDHLHPKKGFLTLFFGSKSPEEWISYTIRRRIAKPAQQKIQEKSHPQKSAPKTLFTKGRLSEQTAP